MNCAAAVTTGFGLGLVSFGSLWLTVGALVRRPRWRIVLGLLRVVRLLGVALVLYGLCREGAGMLLAGLAGMWLARTWLVWQVGGILHAR